MKFANIPQSSSVPTAIALAMIAPLRNRPTPVCGFTGVPGKRRSGGGYCRSLARCPRVDLDRIGDTVSQIRQSSEHLSSRQHVSRASPGKHFLRGSHIQ
jgi:hypothetical protein